MSEQSGIPLFLFKWLCLDVGLKRDKHELTSLRYFSR